MGKCRKNAAQNNSEYGHLLSSALKVAKHLIKYHITIDYKFKISVPTWNEEFDLPDRSRFISDIQDYFEYILKNQERKTVDPSLRIYINKIGNTITFKIKTWYYFELLIPGTMKLPRSIKCSQIGNYRKNICTL